MSVGTSRGRATIREVRSSGGCRGAPPLHDAMMVALESRLQAAYEAEREAGDAMDVVSWMGARQRAERIVAIMDKLGRKGLE